MPDNGRWRPHVFESETHILKLVKSWLFPVLVREQDKVARMKGSKGWRDLTEKRNVFNTTSLISPLEFQPQTYQAFTMDGRKHTHKHTHIHTYTHIGNLFIYKKEMKTSFSSPFFRYFVTAPRTIVSNCDRTACPICNKYSRYYLLLQMRLVQTPHT